MARWELSLPKTNIHVSSDELVVQSAGEDVIARHKLDRIRRVSTRKRFEPICLLFAVIGVCLSYFPFFYTDSSTLRWVLVGLGVACLVLAIFGAIGTRLVLELDSGDISYNVNDLDEHVQGFVVTLQEILTDRNSALASDVNEEESVPPEVASQELLQ